MKLKHLNQSTVSGVWAIVLCAVGCGGCFSATHKISTTISQMRRELDRSTEQKDIDALPALKFVLSRDDENIEIIATQSGTCVDETTIRYEVTTVQNKFGVE